jgi:hypothetical protein
MSDTNIITENRSVEPFTAVKLAGFGNLHIKQGDEVTLTIKAPAALLRKIKTDVTGGTLKIGFRFALAAWFRSARDIREIEFLVTVPTLEGIVSSGAGHIKSDNTITGKMLELKSNGAGDMELDLEMEEIVSKLAGAGSIILRGSAKRQEVTISGAGKFDSFDMETNAALIDSKGSGQCNISVKESLNVTIKGVGKVKYRGRPKITSKMTGLGNLEADT